MESSVQTELQYWRKSAQYTILKKKMCVGVGGGEY